MDWKYKHFHQVAIFNAPVQSVVETARHVAAASSDKIEDSAEGFIVHAHTAWNNEVATFRVASAATGTEVTVDLQVERFGLGGYMLFDVGGYYNAQIDKWFTGISERLGISGEQSLVSKTTSSSWVQRGCIGGCLVWLIFAACLGVPAIALDRSLFPQIAGSYQGPFGILASLLAFAAAILTFVYIAYPDAATSKFIRGRLRRTTDRGRE